MYVIKRDGRRETVNFEKISRRLKNLCYGLNMDWVEPMLIVQKVCGGLHSGISTVELDELAAETAAQLTAEHPDYGVLAARITIDNLQKETMKSFSKTMTLLHEYVHPKTGKPSPLLDEKVYKFIMENAEALDGNIMHKRDFDYDYFGVKTLERGYLMKLDGKTVERPQHMLMRVACGIHCGDLDAVIETYTYMSYKLFTHATPTLFNAGTPNPQLSSCFLLTMKGDSIEGIYDTLKRCAQISKMAGGIGLSVHKIRAQGSFIAGTNGVSNGLVPMLRVFNNTARYVDQGGGKRKGAFAVYLEPWHADIYEFLSLKKNNGAEEMRARDLFYGLWIPDLFMERVAKNGVWSLFCPHECPGLADVHSDEFRKLYTKYEEQKKYHRQVKAQDLWHHIVMSQIETGTPYIMYKDHANSKSNQQNLGTIRSSNLCTEIVEYTAPDEVAVCNLASIALPMFVNEEKGEFDHEFMFAIVQVVTRNLNKIIDVNKYPIQEAENSNMRHRPIGIGVQGLADTFIKLRMPFDSEEARQLNKEIFETIYFAAVTTSMEIAREVGPYPSMKKNGGAPISKGVFQFDLWGVKPDSKRWDWEKLRQLVKKHGVRNSLLIAPMPTASTSQILGNNECFEPYTSNLYVRRTLAGEFVCVTKHLLHDLVRLNLWNPRVKNALIAANGSIQDMKILPKEIRELYRTAWEIPLKSLVQMAADRGAYIDQSQSMNVFMESANYQKLTSMHFYCWKKGLKTGTYYLRTRAAVDPQKVTVDQEMLKQGLQGAAEDENKSSLGACYYNELSSGKTTFINPFKLQRERAGRPDSARLGSLRSLPSAPFAQMAMAGKSIASNWGLLKDVAERGNRTLQTNQQPESKETEAATDNETGPTPRKRLNSGVFDMSPSPSPITTSESPQSLPSMFSLGRSASSVPTSTPTPTTANANAKISQPTAVRVVEENEEAKKSDKGDKTRKAMEMVARLKKNPYFAQFSPINSPVTAGSPSPSMFSQAVPPSTGGGASQRLHTMGGGATEMSGVLAPAPNSPRALEAMAKVGQSEGANLDDEDRVAKWRKMRADAKKKLLADLNDGEECLSCGS